MRFPVCLIMCVVCGLGSAVVIDGAAAPFTPEDDSQVLEHLPESTGSQARALRRLRAALAEDPDNVDLAVDLASRYREIGRAEADPRYYGYAQAALGPWWDLDRPPSAVLLLRAILRQARHDFDGALADLSRVLERQPDNAQAWLTRAMILTVLGRNDEARQSCRALSRLTHALVATACHSHAASLSGAATPAYDALQRALDNDRAAPPRVRLWALTILAEIAARLGRDARADAHFQQALSLGLKDSYLLGAYADFLLDQGRLQAVRDLLADETRPDDLLLRLTIAEVRQYNNSPINHMDSLRARFAASRLRGETLHLRNEARFALDVADRPAEALRLAMKLWDTQREPGDARLFLAAALAAGKPEAARPVLDWLAETKLEDAGLERLVQQIEAVRP